MSYHLSLHSPYGTLNRNDDAYAPSLFNRLIGALDEGATSFHRHLEADETDEAYSFSIALPGYKRGEIEVTVSQDAHLSIVASKAARQSVTRCLSLPSDADAEKVSAKLEDGVLYIVAPKRATAKPRKVEVT